MKFFKYKSFSIKYIIKLRFVIANKLTVIISDPYNISFYEDGLKHNIKNAAYIINDYTKEFWLNNMRYGNENDFDKQKWRKFVKLKTFL
jgi:hypothetical protein